ncbi:MAG: tyrosine-type recombinase/integrase, partial [Thermoproteota archaeon]
SHKDLADGWLSRFESINKLLKKLSRKSKSEWTKRTYLSIIANLCNRVKVNPDELIRLKKEDVEKIIQEYCDELNGRSCSRRYINGIIHVMRSFFKANGIDITLEGYYTPSRYRKRPEYIPTKEEVYAMADCAGSLRNRAIILFLFSTGLRVSTLIALTYGDIKDDLEKGYSIIRVPVYPEMKKRVPGACKNNVPYYTFACEEAVKALRLYLRERIEKYGSIEPYEPLFCSEYNQISFQERRLKFMTPREVQRIIKDAARKAGIANWMYVTPHSLRKTYESMLRSELIDGGRLDVKTQEFLMGHILPGSQDAYYDKTKCEQLRLEYARINFGRKVVENKFSLLETALTKAFEGTGIDWKEVLIEYVKTRMNLCF